MCAILLYGPVFITEGFTQMLNKAEAKALLEQWQPLFEPLINHTVNISFSTHTFEANVKEVRLATQKEMIHKTDKVESDGKNRSPQVFMLRTEEGSLFFNIDPTTVYAITNGVKIVCGDVEVEVTLCT